MKISLNWLKKYVDIKISNDELIRLIGARLVEVEGVIDETHKYDKIYVVKVEKAEKIPETHLTLCQVDCGQKELVQVVCGAPNVRVGMLAAWIAPGAVVPASVHQDAPFVIGKRKMLKKYDSNGMLAGADELDFGDDHSGIVEINPDIAKPGDLLADVFELNDLILEIENKSLTHRPDCFGMIGFAREVAGILGQKYEWDCTTEPAFSASGLDFSSMLYAGTRAEPPLRGEPVRSVRNIRAEKSNQDMTLKKQIPAVSPIHISIADNKICQRYTALVLQKHGELKGKYLTWVDTMLSKSGMKPISPIVDATNYLMLLTGQPLHAFDYDKFVKIGRNQKPAIKVRLAKDGEKLVLLDEKEVELNSNDIVVCSGDEPVALAGAMGGESTAIDETTKNIILESATFSLYNLRKTQMAHGIFSEAITRFTKGQPAYQTMAVAEACAGMLSEGFKVADVVDDYPVPAKEIVVEITTDEINNLLGTKYDEKLIVTTLENVGFKIEKGLKVKVPVWRTDIHIKEDIIEEVGRLLGYDNIQPTLPLHGTANSNVMFGLKRELRDLMAKLGANELLTYSFVSGKLLEKAGQDEKNSYKIVNSISPELQYVRQSLVPSLLDKAYMNEKLPVDTFAIYEMNKVYRKEWGMNEEGTPVEKNSMGLVIAERKGRETAYYKAKKYAARILSELNITAEFLPLKSKTAEDKPFEPKRAAEIVVDGERIGVVGELGNAVRNAFKLAPYVAGVEISLDALCEKKSTKKTIMMGEHKVADLTVTTDETYGDALKKVRKDNPGAEIMPGPIYQAPGQKTRNITFHIGKI